MKRSFVFFSFLVFMFPTLAFGDSFNITSYGGDHSVSVVLYGGDHTVCVPSGSTEEQIREYVAAVIGVVAKLGK